jgi:uncharacterized protein involved in exopolysaccharide biosynthesis
MAEQGPKDLRDYTDFLRRRKKQLLLPFVGILFIGAAVALLLPPIYKSTATILIEGQQIPTDFVRTTVTSFAEERIQIITQRIMGRTRLLEIVDQFNLYADLRNNRTTEEILDLMRKDIGLETISADVIDTRTGRPTQATIAYTLSFQGKNPEIVQRVTNVLASLYLEENLKTRERQARGTSSFLEEELKSLRGHLDGLERQIAVFKEEHMADLPELMQLNLQTLTRIERDLQLADQDVKMLEDRRIYLQGQLETVQPHSSLIGSTGERIPSPEDRVEMLKTQLVSASANLTDQHPDVIDLRHEIGELEKEASLREDLQDKQMRLSALKEGLQSLLRDYTGEHPDVIATKGKIEVLESKIETLSTERSPVSRANREPTNPAYINLTTQIESVALQIAARKKEKSELKTMLKGYQSRLEKTPQVEKAYLNLTRDRENTWTQYQETLKKLMEARVAEGMEQEQKAERFTIIDPAQHPEKPFKPNRVAILLVSVVLGMGVGVGYGSLAEFMDRSVKSIDDVFSAARILVFASIPYIESPGEIKRGRLKKIAVCSVVLLVVACGLLAFHLYVMDLEVFWARATRFVAKRMIL